MRFSWVVWAVAMAVAPVCFGTSEPGPDVAVCLKNAYLAPPGVLERAKQIARGIFKSADVNLVWVETEGAGHRTGAPLYLDVTFLKSPVWDAGSGSDALAEAHPFANTSRAITVRYDRLIDTIGPDKELESTLLAHTLAHEIGHMVENVDHHSGSGVMKARWDRSDYRDMEWKPLEFAPEDLTLLRQGMREWQRRAGAGTE